MKLTENTQVWENESHVQILKFVTIKITPLDVIYRDYFAGLEAITMNILQDTSYCMKRIAPHTVVSQMTAIHNALNWFLAS